MGTDALGVGIIIYVDKTKRIIHNCDEQRVADEAWMDGDHVLSWDWEPYK